MQSSVKHLMLVLLVTLLMPPIALACTTFGLDLGKERLFGKNFDWFFEQGLIIINKRGVVKKAIPHLDIFSDQYARWTSKYGSITFNQYGREIPMGGMNEQGLVVHMMRLNATQYPEADSRPVIHRLQWIQFQLDNYSTVEEVIASDSRLRIYPHAGRTHYLVQDKRGECASIEFLHGKMVYHTRATMPIKVLANSTYTDSMNYLTTHKVFGGKKPVSSSNDSLDRFTRAAVMLKNFHPRTQKSSIDYAFDVLANVAQPSTQWRIVYDQNRRRVYFRTALYEKIRYVDLADFDLSCESPVMVFNISSDQQGNVTNGFYEYTWELNRDMIDHAYKNTYQLRGIGDDIIEWRAKYPDLLTDCRP